jgi:hypothetical protein
MADNSQLLLNPRQQMVLLTRIAKSQLPDWFLHPPVELQVHYLEWESEDLYEDDYLGSLGTARENLELAQYIIRRHRFARLVRLYPRGTTDLLSRMGK